MSVMKPAVSLAAVPGKRGAIIELAKEIEKRGFPAVYCPSIGDGLALCEAIALVTERITIGTAITPIYFRQAAEFASTIAFVHEISNGRFQFGIGVSHKPALAPRGLDGGKPLADTRTFIEQLRAIPRVGELPPIMLATLRKKMIALAVECGDGMIFANGARSHMPESLTCVPEEQRRHDDFLIANMIPTCIDEDLDAARAVNRRTLTRYATLPNYRNYWKEAGYVQEMTDVEKCLVKNDMEGVARCLSDRWLDDTTIAGSPTRVRDELDKWFDTGIKTPILVPSSTRGGQIDAFRELFELFP